MFENDLLEMQYKFWETPKDKEERLKLLWVDLKRKNALGGMDQRSTGEQLEINRQIADIVRRVRWRVDQELVRRSVQPVFKENLYSYDKDEFLFDADFEFVKVKNLLSKSPRLLKEDPVLAVEYLKIINLIKQKKLLEKTSDQFDPSSALGSHYYNVDKEELIMEERMNAQAQKQIEATKIVENKISTGIDNYEEDVAQEVTSTKKDEAKEKMRLMKQFDTVDSVQKSSAKIAKEDD